MVKACAEHEIGRRANLRTLNLTARFGACLWGFECVFELSLDQNAQLCAAFEADGQALEVTLHARQRPSEVRGVIRSPGLEGSFAAFNLRPDPNGLWLEMDISDEVTLQTQRAVFFRLS